MNRAHQILLVIALSLLPLTALAQVDTGFPAFSSYSGGPDVVDNANLNVHISIPVVSKAGRGLPFYYALGYDNSIWARVSVNGVQSWIPSSTWGWTGQTDAATGYIAYEASTPRCWYPSGSQGQWHYWTLYSYWVYYDTSGTPHPLPTSADVSTWTPAIPCGNGPPATIPPAFATDGSGYSFAPTTTLTNPIQVSSRSGTVLDTPVRGHNPTPLYTTDVNGNRVEASTSSGTTTFTDTLGTTPLWISGTGTPTSPVILAYHYAGGTNSVTMHYTAYTIETHFGCTSVQDYGRSTQQTANLVSSVVTPDGTYTITYESTYAPNHAGAKTGRIASITLPTGGVITYSYADGANDINCLDGSASKLTRTTPDGTWVYTHTLVVNSQWTTKIQDPNNKTTTFNFLNFRGDYETSRTLPDSLGTITTCYNGNTTNCDTTTPTAPITERTVTTTIGGQTSKTDTTYDYNSTTGVSYGLPLDVKEYGYGLTLARETTTAYNYNTSCGITNTSILDRPCTVTVTGTNGQGNPGQAAETSYTYDANGNLSKLTSNGLARNFTYDTNGALHTESDWGPAPNGGTNLTTYTNTQCNSALPSTITLPMGLSRSETWNCDGALVASSTDESGQQTTFSYDNRNRLRVTTYPASIGTVTNDYSHLSSSPPYITVAYTNLGSSGGPRTDTTDLDSLGRIKDQTIRGVTTHTYYNLLGEVSSVVIDGSGAFDSYQYDALGRMTLLTHADGNTVQTNWSNPQCPTTTDEAGKTNQVCSDALGRITSVADGLGNTTVYSYDSLDDLHKVTQGAQTRTYNHDSLGRLISATTPESGQTTYNYTSGGDLGSRIDARGITTCYGTWTGTSCDTSSGYDALHRLLTKSYSDGTPAANFFYDGGSGGFGGWIVNGLTNTGGRFYAACTSAAPTRVCPGGTTGVMYDFDAMGRVKDSWQCTPYNCGSSAWHMTYNYDSAGDVTSYTHPEGFTVTQGIDVNQRPTSLTYGANMAVSNITYTGWGAINTMCGGQGCAQSQETRQYNNRLQPVLMELGNSSNLSADYSLTYSYTGSANPPCTIPQGAGNNGTITGSTYTDNVNAGYSHTFTYCYDAVNRLTHAVASGSPAYDLMYSYDQYGNGTCVQGSGGGLCPAMSYDSTTNRLTSIGSTAIGYDAAGNQLNDIWSTYEYDAEGRVKHSYSAGQWQYPMYNALGQRVQDYQGTDPMTLSYPIDIFGQRTGAFAQWPSQGWTGWNVYWSSVAGQRLNMGGASAYIDHADAVGSTTMETDPAGAVQWDVTHYPWGGVFQEQGIRQSEVVMGLDWQVNDPLIPSATREVSTALGRWTTPDPTGGDVTNPQSLNRYAYVGNNPTTLTDPSGLAPPPALLYREYQEFLRALDMCPVCAYTWGQNSFFALELLTTGEGVTGSGGGEWFPGYFNTTVTELPANLPLGTPQKFWFPFKQGFDAALKALAKKKCGEFFGGQGPAMMKGTEYRFVPFSDPKLGAATISKTSVFINSSGPFVTFSPVPGQQGPFGLNWTTSEFRGFILLHELGHQLSSITGFKPDAGQKKLPLNNAQSMEVINGCVE